MSRLIDLVLSLVLAASIVGMIAGCTPAQRATAERDAKIAGADLVSCEGSGALQAAIMSGGAGWVAVLIDGIACIPKIIHDIYTEPVAVAALAASLAIVAGPGATAATAMAPVMTQVKQALRYGDGETRARMRAFQSRVHFAIRLWELGTGREFDAGALK